MKIGNIQINNRTIYEVAGGVVIAGLVYLGTSYVTKTRYILKLSEAAIELKEKENTINLWSSKYNSLKSEFDAAKKNWASKESETKKKISELEKQIKQGISSEELKNACIEGEITRDVYKKLKKYTLK